MGPTAVECFRVTLWVDTEPPPPAPGGQTGLDSFDAASGIRINLDTLETNSIGVHDVLEIVPLLNPVSSIAENSFATSPRWLNEPGFLFTVRPHTLVHQQGLQLSIPVTVAKAFDLEKYNRRDVLLRKVPVPVPSTHCADHVELFFRDQHVGRGEMWRMTMMMADSCAWVGREVTLGALKVKTKVGRVYIKGKRVLSGYITPHTKLIFRSESVKYYLFIQISSEMWSFEEDGSLYREKAILFLEDLFNRWEKIGTSHLVSLLLFSRVFYTEQEKDHVPPPVLTSQDGRAYKDFYKVVVDLEPIAHPHKILDEVHEEIFNFQKHTLTYLNDSGERKPAGVLSYAPEGNILEAMGIACNSFNTHYIDRDLRRTGVSIVFVTAGTCVYHVDQMLLRLATEWFIAHGIGVDFVSLAKMPLHAVPLFRFLGPDLGPDMESSQAMASGPIDPSLNPIYVDLPSPLSAKSVHYSVPFFIDCSFFSRQQDRPFRMDRFMPRCRMPHIQNLVGEHNLTGSSIPSLTMPVVETEDGISTRQKARECLDAQVVDALPGPLAPLSARKDANSNSGARAVSDSLTVSATEMTRKTSKFEEVNRSPLLKAATPQGSVDFLPLVNQPSAGLSIIPVSSSGSSHGRAASTSTTGSNSGKPGTPALIARLTGLSQQNRSFWPWSTGNSTSRKTDTSSNASAVNRSSSPPVANRLSRRDESAAFHPPREPFLSGVQETKVEATRLGRSDIIRSATSLMPLIHAPRRTVSSSSIQHDFVSADSSTPSSTPRTLTPLVFKKFNPSNPNGNSSGLLSQFRRWSAIFPRPPSEQRSLKWKSLTTPACLPITTDFCPSQEELNSSYLLTQYEFPISGSSMLVKPPDCSGIEESIGIRAAATLREAVSQRLGQCFQLVIPELALTSRPTWLSLAGIVKEAEKGRGAYVDLSLSDHYHRLSIRRLATGKPTLHVQMYTRHQKWKMKSFVYRPAIWWSDEVPGWHEFEMNFKFPLQDSFNFKALDKIVVGLDPGNPLHEHLRYWRTRAVFLPSNASLNMQDSTSECQSTSIASDDENQLAGIMKLQTTLKHVTWQESSESRMSGPMLSFTIADASQHVRNECERLLAFASASRDQRDQVDRVLSLRDPLSLIVEAMLHSSIGIEVKSQMIQLKLTENVFQGDKFVTFLKQQFRLETRDEALKLGRMLESRGMFKEVTHGKQPRALIDENRYYQLNSECCAPKPTRTWFGRNMTDQPADKSPFAFNLKPTFSTATGQNAEESAPSSSTSQTRSERSILNMTRTGIIDLDPAGKSDRSEKAILHCDISHSPSNAWHAEIQWLGITSALVDGLLQQWSRVVKRYGIRMVEENTRDFGDLSDYSLLQKTIKIELALKPPPLGGLETSVPATTSPNYFFEGQLMRSQGFVLDVEADRNFPNDVNIVYSYRHYSFEHSQYIHCSGAAIVQVQDGCFIWADNLAARISCNNRFTGGGGGPSLTGTHAAQLRRAFIDLCSDQERLQEFWDDCVAKLCENESFDQE